MPAVFSVALLNLMGLGIVYPLLTFQALDLGAAPLAVTLLLSVDALMIFAVAPLWGAASDRYGRRPVILLALATAPPSYLLLAAADGLALLFMARALTGISSAVFPVLQAHLADRTCPDRRIVGMASLNAAYGLVFVIGPLIALAGLGPDGDNYALPALVGAFTSGLAVLLALILLRDEVRVDSGDSRNVGNSGSIGGALNRGVVFRQMRLSGCATPLAVVAILGFAFFCMDTTIGLWSHAVLGWRAEDITLVFTAGGGAAVLSQWLLVAPLCWRFGEATTARLAVGVFLFGLAMLVVAPGAWQVVLASMCMGSGMASALSCAQCLLSRAAPVGLQGRVMGISQSCASAAGLLGPLWGGAVFAAWGPNSPFVSSLALLILAFFLLRRLSPKEMTANRRLPAES